MCLCNCLRVHRLHMYGFAFHCLTYCAAAAHKRNSEMTERLFLLFLSLSLSARCRMLRAGWIDLNIGFIVWY